MKMKNLATLCSQVGNPATQNVSSYILLNTLCQYYLVIFNRNCKKYIRRHQKVIFNQNFEKCRSKSYYTFWPRSRNFFPISDFSSLKYHLSGKKGKKSISTLFWPPGGSKWGTVTKYMHKIMAKCGIWQPCRRKLATLLLEMHAKSCCEM